MAGALNALYPDELEAVALQIAARLAALGVGGDDAERIGWHVAEHLRREWGGRLTYIRAPEKADTRQLGLLDSESGSVPDCEILIDLAEQVEERLAAIGLERELAATHGRAVAQHVQAFWGSGQLYLCKGTLYELSLRDQEIFRRFNGENHEWLAREYDLTLQHVYRIVKRVGESERAKRQARLFPTE